MPTLNWIGKEAVVKHHKEVPFRLPEPVPELSCPSVGAGHAREETGRGHGPLLPQGETGNLIVQGDNLHALKALLPRYAGQVKCTYIDPPYNTGNEGWAYNDNVNSPEIRKWQGEVVGKEGGAVMTRRCEVSWAGMTAQHLLPQTAGYAITSDLANVVCSPSRMASGSISNVSEVQS